MIYINYLEKGKTVTGLYCAELLGRFDAELQKKRLHLAKKEMLFHHEKRTGSHLRRRHGQICRIKLELLPHPTYSPDLAQCYFFLFPNLKKLLAGQKFESNDEVIAATEAYFADLQKTCFSDGFKKLEHR